MSQHSRQPGQQSGRQSGQPTPQPTQQPGQPPGTSSVRLAFSWLLVSVPLAYGLYETVVKVANLFTS